MSETTSTPAPGAGARVPLALFVLRLVLGLFLLQWAVEKFVRPEGASKIFGYYYGIDLSASMPMFIGGFEVILVLAFLAGAYKRLTYGLAFLIHAVSTVATYDQLLNPYQDSNHLFTAGIPVLAGFWVLYWLRDLDTLYAFESRRTRPVEADM